MLFQDSLATPLLNEAEVHVVCCDYDSGVCCSDHVNCCPENTTCDFKKVGCVKISSVSLVKTYGGEMTTKTDTFSPKNIVCPDGSTKCPDKNTCCELVTGTFGCCPHPEAKCCADRKYCCPNGYSCDPNSDKCKHGDSAILDLTKVPAVLNPFSLQLKKICGDDTVCASNDTCCKHPDESWACCPAVNAVCCSDGRYCCPQNYTCDMIDNTCKQNDVSFIKIQTKQMKVALRSGKYDMLVNAATNICPGDRYDCKDDQTCCLLLTGAWGCCPGKEAVCCPDKQHCCPAGYKCGNNGECLEVKGFTDKRNLL